MRELRHPQIEVSIQEQGNGTREKPTLVALDITARNLKSEPVKVILTEQEAMWLLEELENV